jgi:hypothetical protein
MRRDRYVRPGLARALLGGAASGLLASFVMEKVQARIQKLGSAETQAAEKDAQGDLEPATSQTAGRAAGLVGRELSAEQRKTGGEIVHYAYGAAWGAAFGALARALRAPALAAGPLFGVLLWLASDEVLVPLAGLSREPSRYPASTHAKALAAHVVYGTAVGAGVRALANV